MRFLGILYTEIHFYTLEATYSPDLLPGDLFLYAHIRNNLLGQRFTAPEEAVNAFRAHVLKVNQSEWKKCYENW